MMAGTCPRGLRFAVACSHTDPGWRESVAVQAEDGQKRGSFGGQQPGPTPGRSPPELRAALATLDRHVDAYAAHARLSTAA
jgi:hypothetical protein